jgi:hypothetical protein
VSEEFKLQTHGPILAIALFNFAKKKDNQLSLFEGDIITVFSINTKSGWWKGESRGEVGKFPGNFCRILDEHEQEAKAQFLPEDQTGSNQLTSESSIDYPLPLPPLMLVEALYDFTKSKDDQLSFQKGDIIRVV